jgi:hypothetical protein
MRARLAELSEQVAVQADGLSVAHFIAERMAAHPVPSVRAYGVELDRALSDPEPLKAVIGEGPLLVLHRPPPVAFVEGELPEPDGSHISMVIAHFVSVWSETVGSDISRLVGPLAARIAATHDIAEEEQRRRWLCTDWLLRTHTAHWLDLARVRDGGWELSAMPPIRSAEDFEKHAAPAIEMIELELVEATNALLTLEEDAEHLLTHATRIAGSAVGASGRNAALAVACGWTSAASRVTEIAQWMWTLSAATTLEFSRHAIAELEESVPVLQMSAVALLGQMIDEA